MNEKVPFTLACVAVLAFACGPRSGNRESAATNVPSRSAAVDPRAPLTPTLDVSVASRDEVRFSFAVTNGSAKRLELTFPSGRTHDVIVLDSIGREVWRWSEGRLFTQAVQNRVVRARDVLAFEEEWKDAAPGRYTAVATLASVNFPLEQRVAFEVR
jgi:hypothetical protein